MRMMACTGVQQFVAKLLRHRNGHIDGLLVDVANERYLIAQTAIEGCLERGAESYATNRARNLITVRGISVPLIRLRDLFNLDGERSPREQVVVISVDEIRVGLDQVIGNIKR